jgi:transcriptional regulatory protein GAL4
MLTLQDRYLTSVERRLSRLENLFSRLHPDIDLEEALAESSGDDPVAATRARGEDATVASVSTSAAYTPTKEVDDSISEAVPDGADGFDWQEDVGDLADGMAALSVEPKGTGYLGSTAGVFFLRSLLFWLGHSNTLHDSQSTAISPPGFYNPAGANARLNQSVTSRQVLDRLIDSYFSVYHRTYPFVHEATFKAQFNEVIPRPQHRSWQMLLHAILALGAWCLNDSASELDDHLYHHALSFGEDESMFESANLAFVQALVLLSNLSQKRNKPNTGSNFSGLATRMALSLGLHRELPDWDINLLQREMRRRVWWGLYMFDSGASTTFGRPILLPEKETMDVRPVLNIPDEVSDAWICYIDAIPRPLLSTAAQCLTAGTTIMPTEATEPTLYSGMRWQSDLHTHSNYISNRLLSSTAISPEDALSMDRSLNAWSETLPPYIRLDQEVHLYDSAFFFAKCRLWWRLWNLKIMLFRQLLLQRAVERSKRGVFKAYSDTELESMTVAMDAASATITSIHNYSQNGLVTRLVAWYSM